MLRIYSSGHKRQNSAFWDYSVYVKKPAIKEKKYDILNIEGRKGFTKQIFEESPKVEKNTLSGKRTVQAVDNSESSQQIQWP